MFSKYSDFFNIALNFSLLKYFCKGKTYCCICEIVCIIKMNLFSVNNSYYKAIFKSFNISISVKYVKHFFLKPIVLKIAIDV